MQILLRAHDSLVALRTGIEAARGIARWTVRGRLASTKVTEEAEHYDRNAIRLYAAALLFAGALVEALRKQEAPPPPSLRDRIARIEKACAGIAEMSGSEKAPAQLTSAADPGEPVPPSWQLCVTYLRAVEDALNELGKPM